MTQLELPTLIWINLIKYIKREGSCRIRLVVYDQYRGIPGSSYREWGMRWEGIENWERRTRSFYSVYIVFLKLFGGLMVSLIIYSTTFC